MSQHSGGTRRNRFARLRNFAFVGVLVGALGFASPSFADVLGVIIQLPGATAPTNLTASVDETLGLPNAVVDATGINPTLDNLLGVTNVQGGVTQTTTALTQLLSGLQAGTAVAAPVVTALATDAAQTAVTNLQNRVQATVAEALALDPNTATDATAGVIADLEGQATSEVAGLLPLALTTGLQVAQSIITPVCSLTAIPGSLLPGVGLDTTRFYNTQIPLIQQTDAGTNQLLRDTYSNLYDDTLASVNSIPTAGPILSALLTLLKYNWTSTYTPPGSTTPIVTSTKALMNVPTPIDVDNDGIFDLCGTTSFAFTGSGTSITGIKLTQTITKMPLAKPVLPVEINGGLLNVINVGYDTTESTVPIIYTGSATMDSSTGGRLSFDGNYAVHRGTNLTIPPVILKDMNLYTGTLLPVIPPLFTPAPKPIVTQEFCLGGCSAIKAAYRHENVPNSTHVDTPLASVNTIDVNYTGSEPADSFGYQFSIGGPSANLGVSTVVGGDRPAIGSGDPRMFSVPTSARSCFGAVSCSPYALSGDTNVSGFTASAATSLDQDIRLGSANTPNVCTAVGAINQVVRINGATQFYTGAKKGGSGVGSGHIAIDTGDQVVDGCTGLGSVGVLSGGTQLTLPAGFKANNRSATYHQSGLSQPIPDSKSGTATCPTGTVADYSLILATAHLMPVICPFPVTPGTVTIGGSPTVDSTLTANLAGWGPGAPNDPTFSYQWNKCDASGGNCQPITGATGPSYVLQYGAEGPSPVEPTDFHHTFTVTVKGHNLDGDATVTSAATPLVELPPRPVNTAPPTLGSNRHVGDPLVAASVGTWNPGATSYKYQWQRCLDAAGLFCSDIAGANGTATSAAGISYVLAAADKTQYIRVGLIGHNHGGDSLLTTYSALVRIPGDPVNTGNPPSIKNGPANAVGASVATGDNLTASTSVADWTDTNAPFTFQWQRCNSGGSNCVDISGATSANYQVQHPADDGSTLRVKVTGHGLNGTGDAFSGTTGVVLFNDLSAKPVTQIPDGSVNATVAGAGTTTYVGGSFDTVGAPTGGSGLIPDSGSGSTVSLASATAGAANGGVSATVPDGSGGYFLGGSFTQVKGVQCPALAHLLSDGTVDQTYCYGGLAGTVNTLTRTSGAFAGSSKVLIVGGDFTFGAHKNLMFIDPGAPASPVFTTGGDPNGPVNSVAANLSSTSSSNNLMYLGGKFSQVAGTQASLLASETLTWTGGQLTTAVRNGWSAGACTTTPSGTSACADPAASVNTVASLSTGFVAVGGRFSSYYRVVNNASPTNQANRSNAFLIGDNGSAPTLLGWAPVIAGGAQTVNAIAPGVGSGLNNISIYVGGDFTTVNGVAVKNLAEVGCSFLGGNVGSGTGNGSAPMNTWLPNPNGPVTSLAWAGNAAGSTLIVGGAFTTMDTRPNTTTPFTTLVRHRLAKIVIGSVTGSTLPVVDGTWDPNAGRTVRTVSRDATLGTVTVGGDFLVLGGKTRNNLAEFDPNTGVTAWNPGADGSVSALAFRTGTVYVGGAFSNAGGSARADLAAIDGATGVATGWNPGANGQVNALATDASNVYVGGTFSTAGGQPRASLAAINSAGAATSWSPATDGVVKALAVGNGNVYVGGSFTTAGGQPRTNVAAIDATGAATAFAPNADDQVLSIAVSNAGVYLGGKFTHLGSDARSRVAFVDPVTGVAAAWNPGVNGTVNAVFLVGSQLFVGGSFTTAGGQGRINLANLDTGSDNALAFNPAPNGEVKAISRTSGGSIAVGGLFTIISGQAAPALGFYGG